MSSKRLFIAAFVSRFLFERQYPVLNTAFNECASGKWTEIQNLHFTFKFLGNVPEEKIPEVADLISDKLVKYESVLKFNGLGVLMRNNKPDVLYARVFSPDKGVLLNFNEIESRLTNYGFKKEKGRFIPHVTLLRIKNSNDNFAEVMEANKGLYIGKQTNYKINLVASTLTQQGPIYEIIGGEK